MKEKMMKKLKERKGKKDYKIDKLNKRVRSLIDLAFYLMKSFLAVVLMFSMG
jgi:hypothetical protein